MLESKAQTISPKELGCLLGFLVAIVFCASVIHGVSSNLRKINLNYKRQKVGWRSRRKRLRCRSSAGHDHNTKQKEKQDVQGLGSGLGLRQKKSGEQGAFLERSHLLLRIYCTKRVVSKSLPTVEIMDCAILTGSGVLCPLLIVPSASSASLPYICF